MALREAWGEVFPDYLNKMTAPMPKLCKTASAAKPKAKFEG